MHIFKSSLRVFVPVRQVVESVVTRHISTSNMVRGKINFNTKHLRKGDPLPPYNGKLRVYNMRYCPYAQRTILALNAKQLDYEVVNINLVDKPEWLTSKSEFAKVPALEIEDGVSIYESLVTVEYLDDVYPQRPLLPKDAVMKAFDKIIIESIGPIHSLFIRLIKSPETITDDHVTAYNKALEFVQAQLKKRGTKFLDGGEPGYADYMIWPWFERVIVYVERDARLKIDAEKFKLLNEYIQNMLKDPAVAEYLVPKEVLFEVLDGYLPGRTPNYDIVLEN